MILRTGAMGYVGGGRLLHAREAEGPPVRCLVRRPGRFPRDHAPAAEIVCGDVTDPAAFAIRPTGVHEAIGRTLRGIAARDRTTGEVRG